MSTSKKAACGATFSVVIPTYNRCDLLLECLDSVVAQRRQPEEVIVIDDGSTDGTSSALEQRKGISLLQLANAGPGAARNRGATAATGDYLVFLDSDDLWFPWSLEVMSELVKKHDHPALLFARFQDFSRSEALKVESLTPTALAFEDYLSSAKHKFFAGAGMMVVRREIFLAEGGFAEDRYNAEDHDLALRLGNAPGFVQITAPVIVGHRMHDGNEMGNTGNTLAGLERLVRTEKLGGYPGGQRRSADRRALILHHVRPAVVAAARLGEFRSAARLYRSTFLWNLRAGRGTYLAGVLAIAVAAQLTGSQK